MISDAEYAKYKQLAGTGLLPAAQRAAMAEYEQGKAAETKATEVANAGKAAQTFQDGVNSTLAPVSGALSGLAQSANVTSNVDPAFREYQLQLAQQLQAQANGQGPSIAQNQLQAATDRTLSQSLGAIRAATGANAGLSARTAALASAQQMGSAANASGTLRLQEQQDAQKMLAGVSADGRSADIETDKNSITAQGSTNATILGALGGMTDIAALQVNPYSQVYQVGADAAQTDKKLEFEAAEREKDRAAERARERKANRSKLQDQITGAIITGGATYAGAAAGKK